GCGCCRDYPGARGHARGRSALSCCGHSFHYRRSRGHLGSDCALFEQFQRGTLDQAAIWNRDIDAWQLTKTFWTRLKKLSSWRPKQKATTAKTHSTICALPGWRSNGRRRSCSSVKAKAGRV